MRGIVILAAVSCVALPFAVTAQEPTDACTSCHRDALSLDSWDARELATRIREMRDGAAPHVVPIPPLDDAAIDALADALTGS